MVFVSQSMLYEFSSLETIYLSIYVNGTQVAHSERAMSFELASEYSLSTQAHIAYVPEGAMIEAFWRTSGEINVILMERSIIALKVN